MAGVSEIQKDEILSRLRKAYKILGKVRDLGNELNTLIIDSPFLFDHLCDISIEFTEEGQTFQGIVNTLIVAIEGGVPYNDVRFINGKWVSIYVAGEEQG